MMDLNWKPGGKSLGRLDQGLRFLLVHLLSSMHITFDQIEH